jgi:hypothetical protein
MHWIREIEVDNIDKGPATEAEETSRAAAGLAETLVEESASTFARSACGIGMDERDGTDAHALPRTSVDVNPVPGWL